MSKFSYFESGPDGGQSAAIAKGLEKTTGDIMAYLNSDDVLLPGTLTFVANYFAQNPDVDVVYGHRCIIDEKGVVIGHWILPPHSNFLMKRWDLIPQESCFWRRRIFEREGNVDSTFRFAMDYDLFVRYMRSGKFTRTNRFLAAFRIHPQAKSSTQLTTIGHQEVQRVYRDHQIGTVRYLGHLFPLSVRLRSAYYLKKNQSFPGLPPGTGYNIEELWG